MIDDVVFGIQDDLRDADMSTENITEKRNLPGNRLLVVFETREGKEEKYSYGPAAKKKILAGRDPADFKAQKEK
jgi:hypothetical protein